jgi:tetratricopeptide (TPR) repeat protein
MLTPINNEFEKSLCEKVFNCESQLEEAIYDAAKYFASTGRHEFAYHLLVRFANFTMNQEKDAFFRLTAGQVAEQAGEFSIAADEYRKGLKNKISNEDTAYFLNNNLGYSLNQIGKFDEAEGYCREAITIDSTRYNAHKNLGLALQGLGKWLEAAISLQRASLVSKDPRAGKHLKELLKDHPEIKDSFKKLKIVQEGYAFIQNPSKLDC